MQVSVKEVSKATKRERLGKAKIIDGFIRDIESRPLAITGFDERLWLAGHRSSDGRQGGLNEIQIPRRYGSHGIRFENPRLAFGRAVFVCLNI